MVITVSQDRPILYYFDPPYPGSAQVFSGVGPPVIFTGPDLSCGKTYVLFIYLQLIFTIFV